MAHLRTVSTGTPREVDWGRVRRSAIAKVPVTGPVAVGLLGPAGDQVADTKHHGGRDQAVYAYAREDLDWWEGELGRAVPDGMFGENLTTVGVDLTAAVIGTRWRVGSVLLEVASVRTPCNTFAAWLKAQGYDTTRWARRFTAGGRPGAYLRVVEEGELAAGDELHVEQVPDHGVRVADMFAAFLTDTGRLPELAVIDDLATEPRRKLEAYLRRQG